MCMMSLAPFENDQGKEAGRRGNRFPHGLAFVHIGNFVNIAVPDGKGYLDWPLRRQGFQFVGVLVWAHDSKIRGHSLPV